MCSEEINIIFNLSQWVKCFMMSSSSLWSQGPISALDRSSNLPSICFITLFNQDLIFWKSLELWNSPIDVHHNSQPRLGLYLGSCPKLNWILGTADRLKTWSFLFLAAWSWPENGRLYWVSFIHREFEACLAQQATIRPSSTRRRKAVFSGSLLWNKCTVGQTELYCIREDFYLITLQEQFL